MNIAPTVTASDPNSYKQEIERIQDFAERIHIDFADDTFTPVQLLQPVQAWLPEDKQVDFHVMLDEPRKELETLIALQPSLIVFHAESNGDIVALMKHVQSVGIKAGIALLIDTQPELYANEIAAADHVLLFGGRLGYHGGEAALDVLQKIPAIRALNETAELGWDGGINDNNIAELAAAGISVFNVGGFIQKSEDPQGAYGILEETIKA